MFKMGMIRTLALSWLIIFNLKASIVPSFIKDSKTSSGVITEEDSIQVTKSPPLNTRYGAAKLLFQIWFVENCSLPWGSSGLIDEEISRIG